MIYQEEDPELFNYLVSLTGKARARMARNLMRKGLGVTNDDSPTVRKSPVKKLQTQPAVSSALKGLDPSKFRFGNKVGEAAR